MCNEKIFLCGDKEKKDLTSFEGNAQGIRLVHTLLNLNLTYSQASGIMKYTRCGAETPPEESDTLNYLKKKVGFYLSEQEYIGKLRHALDIAPGCRSPFSYIMEAADDISYGMADLEDAVEKKHTELPATQNRPKGHLSGTQWKFARFRTDTDGRHH